MKEVGEKGQNCIEGLSKYIPTENSEKSNKDENISKGLTKIDNTYNEYNFKK